MINKQVCRYCNFRTSNIAITTDTRAHANAPMQLYNAMNEEMMRRLNDNTNGADDDENHFPAEILIVSTTLFFLSLFFCLCCCFVRKCFETNNAKEPSS